jgi:hypothetical protein
VEKEDCSGENKSRKRCKRGGSAQPFEKCRANYVVRRKREEAASLERDQAACAALAAAAAARRSTDSCSGTPECPRTHCQRTLCRLLAAINSCQRPWFRIAGPLLDRQLRACQSRSKSVIPEIRYRLSDTTTMLLADANDFRPSMAARSSIRLLVVFCSVPDCSRMTRRPCHTR